MRLLLALFLFASACVPPAARPIDRRYFAEGRLKKILVMEFSGNSDLTEESTGLFIAMLSTQPRVEILRSEPVRTVSVPWYTLFGLPLFPRAPTVDGRTITIWDLAEETVREFSRMLLLSPMPGRTTLLERAREEARRRSADLVVLGSITSTGEHLGRNCVSTVEIYDPATGDEVAVLRGYYNQFWTFSSRPVARRAVAMTAQDTLALLK